MDPHEIDQTVRITGFQAFGDGPGSRAQLVILRGKERGRVVELYGPAISIGRRLDNNLVLLSASVSKYHAQVESDGQHHHVRDLKSTNGTCVNHVRLSADEPMELRHGDTLQMGDVSLLYCQAGDVGRLEDLMDVSFDMDEVRREVDALLKDFPRR
ncbi:MAG: FHA domain-containing protein [Planctomycetota bacterium]